MIGLLRAASSVSTPTLSFSAQPWNLWTYGGQSLVWDLPLNDSPREKAC